MSLKRWAAKRDANEGAIALVLIRAGAAVAKLSDEGVCDLLVWYNSQLFLLECKSRHGRATKAQVKRSVEGWPVLTVRTEEAALRAIGAIS